LSPTPAEEKREYFALQLNAGVTSLHLDPRCPGVQVPLRFAELEWLILNYSYRYGVRDFAFDDDAVFASLTFAGQPFPCRVPWKAVFAITDEARTEGRVWEDDLPEEMRLVLAQGGAKADEESPAVEAPPPEPTTAASRPQLRVVRADLGAAPDTRPAAPTDHLPEIGPDAGPEPSPPRRGHLRRIQ
jgi:stringent starvation protein B